MISIYHKIIHYIYLQNKKNFNAKMIKNKKQQIGKDSGPEINSYQELIDASR